MKKEISYNPFKMWGSWIVAVLSFILAWFGCIGSCSNLLFASFTIFGFLIGWGIHYLFRWLGNRKN